MLFGIYFINYRLLWFSIRGLVLSRELDIPPPILKENADEYFELLAKEKDADRWIEKYSIDTYPSIDNTNKQMSDKKYSIKDPEVKKNTFLENILISFFMNLVTLLVMFILFTWVIVENLNMSNM